MKPLSITFFGFIILFLLGACTRIDIHQTGALVPPTTLEDPELPQLLINGVPLHLEAFGDISKPIMIFLHGGPGFDYRAMISQKGGEFADRYPDKRTGSGLGLSALQDDYFLVFYDRRGSGLSPRFDKGEIRFDDQLADLHTIIEYFLREKKEQTGIADEQVYLFGWSFGGYLATAYVNSHPEKIRDLIIYEPRPFNQELFDMMTITSPFGQLTEDYVDGVITGSTYVVNTDHETADYQWAVGASGNFFPEFHNPDIMPFWRVGFQVNQDIEREITRENRDIVSNLGAFNGNTLYFYGSLSARDAVKPGFIEKVSSYFPRTSTYEIPQTGHYGPWEQAGPIISAIRSFIQ